MDTKGVARIFEILGLPVPSQDRLQRIADSGRSATKVRDDLLAWGKSQGGDTYQKMIRSLVDSRIGDAGTSEAQRQSIVDQIISGEATIDEKYADIDEHIHGGNPPGGGGGDTTKAPKEESKEKKKVGKDLTIMHGEDMTWHFDRNTGKWYVEYGLPNSNRSMVFEASPEEMDQIWGEGRRPRGYKNTDFKTLTQRTGVTYGGNIHQMAGTGSFEGHVDRITNLALDDGKLPEWARADGAVLDILFVAQAEEKGEEWVLDQISALPSFKKRFPKIQKFMSENNLTLTEGIKGFLEFEAGVNKSLQSFGYENTMKKVSPDMIGNLLDRGYNLETIQDTVAGFKRMKEFKPAMDAFNQVLEANGVKPLTKLDEILKFVQGKAPSAMYDLWEQSSIQEAAVSAGLGDIFSVRDAIKASKGGDFTLETATQGMQKAAELLLRLRHEVSVGKYGLDHEELIDISMGLTPRSGRPQSEIFENINRAVASAKKSLQGRSKPFTSFTEEGRPQAASLQSMRQQT